MAATYRPAFQGQLEGHCALGSVSCTSFAFAMAGDRATLGKTVPKGCDVRKATGDTSGGTSLRDNAGALWARYKIGLVSVFYAGFGDLLDSLSEGRGVVVQIGYRPVRDSAFRGSESFTGGHAVYVNEYDAATGRVLVYDPLADGRRAGIAQGPDWWPAILLKVAAGELVTGGSGSKVGFGKAWYAYTRVTAAVAHTTPLVTTKYGSNGLIAAAQGFTDSTYVMSLKKGQVVNYEARSGTGLTRMSRAIAVPYIGNAGSGWKAVVVNTAGHYSDGVIRATIAYVPTSAGEVTAR